MKKRVLAVALIGAVFLPATPASAEHICLPGRPERCIAHPVISVNEICVTSNGNPVVCVP